MRFNLTISNEKAIAKLKTLGKGKGKYIEGLILNDIRLEELEKRVERIERGEK